jgi:hypothetical protein
MKFLFLLILLGWSGLTHGQVSFSFLIASQAANVPPSTQVATVGASPAADATFGGSTRFLAGGSWTSTITKTITRVDLDMWVTSSPSSCTVVCEIWSTSSGTPSTLLATSANSINANTFPCCVSGNATFFSWTGFSLPIVNGTAYAFVLHRTGSDGGTTVEFRRKGGVSGPSFYDSASGSSWSVQVSNTQLTMNLWGY